MANNYKNVSCRRNEQLDRCFQDCLQCYKVITTMLIKPHDDRIYCAQMSYQACFIDISYISNRLAAIWEGDFSTPSFGVRDTLQPHWIWRHYMGVGDRPIRLPAHGFLLAPHWHDDKIYCSRSFHFVERKIYRGKRCSKWLQTRLHFRLSNLVVWRAVGFYMLSIANFCQNGVLALWGGLRTPVSFVRPSVRPSQSEAVVYLENGLT